MSNNRTNSLLAFLLGGAVGAGIALLLAPASGAETRRKLRDGIEDAGDWANEKIQDAKYGITEKAGKVRQMVTDKKEDIQAAYEAGKEAYNKRKEVMSKEST